MACLAWLGLMFPKNSKISHKSKGRWRVLEHIDVDVDVDIDYNHRETRSQNGGRIGLEKTANDPRSLNFLHQVIKELVECIDDFSQESFVKV